VVVFDSLKRGWKEPIDILKKKYSSLCFYKGDLKVFSQINKVFEKEKIVGVLHFAALCLVNESMEKPADYFENNVFGTLNLLKAMRRHLGFAVDFFFYLRCLWRESIFTG